ncbi:MAG: hypothetical protein IT371_10400 [Deltaproteobacteria bacterium]|nr:hypothetical protein [Deltaproteobacteria bacterium]
MGRTYEELCKASAEEIEEVMRQGRAPALESLAGWEFRGYNTGWANGIPGLPTFQTGLIVDVGAMRKFKKGFRPTPGDPTRLQGYNVKVEQNGLENPWIEKLRGGESIKHGLFDVYPVRLSDPDHEYPNAVFLNYDCGRNPLWDPSRLLRDYLVCAGEGDDLLVGKGYGAIGSVRLHVGTFILERHNPNV